MIEEELKRFVISIAFVNIDEDFDTDNNSGENENCGTNVEAGNSIIG